MTDVDRITAAVHPDDLVATCLSMSPADYFSACGDRPVLMVRLAEHPELLPGLYASWQKQALGPAVSILPDRLGYTTLMQSDVDVGGRTEQNAGVDRACQMLRDSLTFLYPLHRRSVEYSGFSFTVGRHPTNDIVLRHASVSKFHAWFALDGRRGVRLSAPPTKNGTLVNGSPRAGDATEPLTVGDELRFGLIQARLVQPGTLWNAIRQLYP